MKRLTGLIMFIAVPYLALALIAGCGRNDRRPSDQPTAPAIVELQTGTYTLDGEALNVVYQHGASDDAIERFRKGTTEYLDATAAAELNAKTLQAKEERKTVVSIRLVELEALLTKELPAEEKTSLTEEKAQLQAESEQLDKELSELRANKDPLVKRVEAATKELGVADDVVQDQFVSVEVALSEESKTAADGKSSEKVLSASIRYQRKGADLVTAEKVSVSFQREGGVLTLSWTEGDREVRIEASQSETVVKNEAGEERVVVLRGRLESRPKADAKDPATSAAVERADVGLIQRIPVVKTPVATEPKKS